MYRAVVFNVADLQEFEGFNGDDGYHEVDHERPDEAAIMAVKKAIGDDIDPLDVYLAFDVIMAYDHPCGCVYLIEG